MKIRFLFIFFLLLSVAGFSKDVKIQIVVTADVHARLFSYDFVNDRPFNASLASVHYMMQSARSRSANNIILLDNGDLLQGTPAAYYANFEQESRRNLFSRVMNLMKYDAATVGNHDIEAGPEVYNRLIQEFSFPYLGANVLNAQTGEPHFLPYTIIERQQIRVAVLGLTTTGVPNWLPPHLWKGLEFQGMIEAAEYWLPYIVENEQPDAIIGLFHSGMGPEEVDRHNPEPENAALFIARNVPGFDVIFTAHDHRERVQTVKNIKGQDVLIVGPGPFAETLGVAEITFERLGRREFRKNDIRGELVSAKGAVSSSEFMKAFEKDVEQIAEFANQQVGTLKNSLAAFDSFYGSAPFSDLVHKVQLNLTGASISFTAPLTFNDVLSEGILKTRDFFKLYQYENYLYAMELSGKEIQDYLEYSYSLWLNEMKGPDDHLLLFRLDEHGNVPDNQAGNRRLRHPYFNFDSAAGIRYTVDASKPVGSRVNIVSMEDGSAFEYDAVYRVAINSYRGSGGGGHLTSGAGIAHEKISERIVFTSDKDLRTEIINFFKENKNVEVQARNNWKIIPEQWVPAARKKDKEALGI